MEHNPTPPNPLPSKYIWDAAEKHFKHTISNGIKPDQYARAALELLLDIIEPIKVKTDHQISLLWPVSVDIERYRRWLTINTDDYKRSSADSTQAFDAIEGRLRAITNIITEAQKKDPFFPDDFSFLAGQYAQMDVEQRKFADNHLPVDRHQALWFGSLYASLNQLARNMREELQPKGKWPYDTQAYVIHKAITIMAIHRENEEGEDWLDWTNIQGLAEAEVNMKNFLTKLDEKLKIPT